MMTAKFLDEFVRLRVRHQIVIADTGTNEYFFDTVDVSYRPQDIQIITVIHLHVWTNPRIQTILVGTNADFQLLFAGRKPEVCRRSADIMDIALKSFCRVSASASRTIEALLRLRTCLP